MVAAIPPKTNDSEKNDFDVLLSATTVSSTIESHTEEQLRKELSKADPHGSLPGCMACHYKLDPQGRTFTLSASGLSHKASPGALVYKTGGNNVNILVQGLAELAEKIVQQKEYVDCQVQTYWKWFIDQDVPKTDARHQELVETFEKSERRPLNFITYLVQTPEFKARPVFLNENQIWRAKPVNF